ncbi:hypothetical protein HGG74_05120 [Arthrobacter sp. E918]|uniref:STAS domain-containing protein n=1 Tax=Arthrobacter mobilis TaxID=2724944 RepID=A0A7X6K5L0_9MICC|nr:hypothetical protein [Arthrobacter mobilis]
MVQKLRVVVRFDLGCETARIKVLGKVDLHTLTALYSLIRRTNSIRPNLRLEVDLSKASAEAEALADLHQSCDSGRLPEQVDPARGKCHLRVVDPVPQLPTVRGLARLSA